MAGKRSASTTPQGHHTNNPQKTPSKHKPISLINRLVAPISSLGGILQPSQSPASPSDHPVEVIGRIREHPEGPNKQSSLKVLQNGTSVRVRSDQGYREFTLDGISLAEDEDLQSFYKKYVESRIESVKVGGKCTIMMYGPTGAGKSHTMFGSAKEPGIAYRALQNILGESSGSPEKKKMKSANGSPEGSGKKLRVIVQVLEIYNEDIFDLLATTCPNAPNGPWMKPRARLEIMGKKAKNAISISGTNADQIAKEITKVEKRRVVKSTLCNERSSRSHCLVMLDVPAIGGRLVLVDMAGSENLEQAGMGTDLKMQTGKINQGNIALKRVVEAIANGDSYIPFRDSKLTMLLQDSFEDDEAKILMILCASPDPKDMHKTIGTLEYGCKAKCIVRLHMSPVHEKSSSHERAESSVLEVRIRTMETYISKLEAENQNKEKEKQEIVKELISLKEMFAKREETKENCSKCCNDELRIKMEKTITERQRVAEEFIKSEKEKLEEKEKNLDIMHEKMQTWMKELEREIEILMKRIHASSETVEAVTNTAYTVSGKRGDMVDESFGFEVDLDEEGEKTSNKVQTSTFDRNIFVNVTDNCHESTSQSEKDVDNLSSDLLSSGVVGHQMYEPEYNRHESTLESEKALDNSTSDLLSSGADGHQMYEPEYGWMPAIPEEPEEEEADPVVNVTSQGISSLPYIAEQPSFTHPKALENCLQINMEIDASPSGDRNGVFGGGKSSEGNDSLLVAKSSDENVESKKCDGDEPTVVTAASRRTRIENIFLLCGNRRELAAQKQQNEPLQASTPELNEQVEEEASTDYSSVQDKLTEKAMRDISPAHKFLSKTKHTAYDHVEPSPSETTHEGSMEASELDVDKCEVHVKWETSKDSCGKLIDTIRMMRNATLRELRREVEQHLSEEVKHDFIFLMLGDPSGSPVAREDEMQLLVTALPDCHRQRGSKLACLRPQLKPSTAALLTPLCSKENQMNWNNSAMSFHLVSPHSTSLLKPSDRLVVDSSQKSSNTQRNVVPIVSPVKGLRL